MFAKNHRQIFRGLSHQQKVKKIQKITRVPLQNLKTNIVQSDLQQDDVQVPICLLMSSKNKQQKSNNKILDQMTGKKKIFDQQKINKTIQRLTSELYSLETDKQNQSSYRHKNQQTVVSLFSIQDSSIQQRPNNSYNKVNKSELQDFYSLENISNNILNHKLKGLQQITNKIHQQQNKSLQLYQKNSTKKQEKFRQTEPIQMVQNLQLSKKLLSPKSPKFNRKSKQESLPSKESKRFSRTKRNQQQVIEPIIQKKLKFNRSNKKNIPLKMNFDKQNNQNIYTAKRQLLTERLSYQQIPTFETFDQGLKKRRNIGKNFMTFQKQNLKPNDIQRQKRQNIEQNKKNQDKNSIKRVISGYEQFSKNSIFIKLQKGETQQILNNDEGINFLEQLFKKYKQSIDLLKRFQ